MYIIKMNKDKSLISSKKVVLYQHEKLVDKIQFLFPETYDDLTLSEYTAILKWQNSENTSYAEVLSLSPNLYHGKLCYILPVDTNLTANAGDVKLRITFVKVDTENKQQHILHTGEAIITIQPLSDYFANIPDQSLEFIDQLVCNLNTKIEEVETIFELYEASKADDITVNDNMIQLTSNGKPIGSGVYISSDSGAQSAPHWEPF